MIYDSHTHLNTSKLFENWNLYLDNFISKGGKGLVNVGADDFYNDKTLEIYDSVLELKKQKKISDDIYVLSSIGYHPLEIVFNKDFDVDSSLKNIKKRVFSNKEKLVAVGECGIDFHKPGFEDSKNKQQKLFAGQCDIAREVGLPIMIHSRDGFEETMEVLQDYKDLKIYFHCRGYTPSEVEKVLNFKSDIFFGFCGNITYKNAEDLRLSLDIVPKENLLLETDAPYLTPQIVRNKTNEPVFVDYIYDFVSERLSIDRVELEKIIENNFWRLYDR